MGVETDILEVAGGFIAGVGLSALIRPSPLERALFATTDHVLANRIAGMLKNAGINVGVTAPTVDAMTVKLVDPTMPLIVLTVSQADFAQAQGILSR
jgi:hypothetical protein